ncbi:type I polyketide synthase [Xenorhabdus bovienii]|uniref:type I polyketide synthase n=1 Tax=Xenorhabdus bovienii TaxID=40576 RepID=UPI0023B255A1|nr:type I polyketide synthase [Xenorhabdus bovienii]MDE9539676.1 acyltransferase domain-containing protein [Xenorhabdus bovienii]
MKDKTKLREQDIAIVGMSARFPGAEDATLFWQNLLDNIESISTFSEEELRASGVEEEVLASPNYIRRRGILGNALHFDANFFDITPRDAEIMDPQHRVFLECCWHAFEDAGYVPDTYAGKVGVFGGTGTAWHLNTVHKHPDVLKYTSGASIVTNNDKDYVTTRVSYKLNLQGPSINVQTACSTSMVAVVMGINSLLNRESDLVIAGGVSIDIPERRGYHYMQGGMESADGRCYAFDSRANGTVFSRGAGVVVLKRLKDAVSDGDHIYAVLKGGAINNDGNTKVGYTAPSIQGQIAVAKQAIINAQIEPVTISFVEAHGTATTLGDPIEFTSLSQTFREFTDKTQFCRIGSVKTNIGHTDAASGIASLIKASLALENGKLPASLHYMSPNPHIDFETSPFVMNTKLHILEASDVPHRALVNSFGVGGTNACVILESTPDIIPSDPYEGLIMLPFSAKSTAALEMMKQRMCDYLKNHEEINLSDVAYTLQIGRKHFSHSTVLVGNNRDKLLEKLEQPSPIIHLPEKSSKSVVFMFPGQGNQYINMAHDLYITYRVFREIMDYCCQYLEPILGLNLQSIIFQEENNSEKERINETQFTQPALFVVEYSLAQLWISWGIKPDVMIGHSVGEYVAACISGVFSLEDALKAVALRGKLVQGLPTGSMLAVLMDEKALSAQIQGYKLEIAAVNYPGLCVVAGETDEAIRFQKQLEDNNIFCKPLDTSHGFHSYMMEPILPAFKEVIDNIDLHSPRIPFISTVTGEWMTDSLAKDSNYWVRHVRNPVLFSHAFNTLITKDDLDFIFLEVGPGRSLESAARQHIKSQSGVFIYSSLPIATDIAMTGESLLMALGNLWACGIAVAWENFYTGKRRLRLPLPGYPFERKEFKLPDINHNQNGAGTYDTKSVNARKRKKADIGDWFYIPRWKQTIPAKFMESQFINPETECWLLFVDEMGVAERIQRQLTNSGHKVLTVCQGHQYQENHDSGSYVISPETHDNYILLLQSIKAQGLRPTRIVNLWNLSPEIVEPQFLDYCDSLYINTFYSPLYLQQALISENLLENLHLLFVTNNIFSIADEKLYSPEKALLIGPARVLYHEYSEVQCHLIDIDVFSHISLENIAQYLIAESHILTHGSLVAYRGCHRWEEDYQAIHLTPHNADQIITLKDDGVYLITGGLGGLGALVAGYLSEISNATLILTYLTGLPARNEWQSWLQSHPIDDPTSKKIAAILYLEDNGNQVHLAQVDICDYSGMRDLLSQFSQIDGVFHTAGIAGGGIIPLKDKADCARVLHPKVAGSLILHELLKNKQPDFFIMFSSITSIAGDAGRIDYCSGNAFMDAFAHYRNQYHKGRTVSINWGRWGDVGMAVNWSNQKKDRKDTIQEKVNSELLALVKREGLQEIYRVNLTIEDWVINEHRLVQQPTLVGTTVLSLLHDWITHCKSGESLQVKSLFLTQPLIYHNGWPRLVNLFVIFENNSYKFSLKSRGILDKQWQEHALGVIGLSDHVSDQAAESLDTIRTRCTTKIPFHPLKAYLDTVGLLSLSHRWNNHQEMFQGDNNEWLIHIELDPAYSGDFTRYQYHPAIIDAASIRGIINVTKDEFLPISYGHVTYYSSLSPDCYAHVKLKGAYQPQDPSIVMDIIFFSTEGSPLLKLEKYTLIKLSPDNLSVESGYVLTNKEDTLPVKVNLADKDILFYEGLDALKRQFLHLEFDQLVVVTSDLHQLIDESVPEHNDNIVETLNETERNIHTRPALSVDCVEPENDIEREIVKIWQLTLGIYGIGVDDNFTELGGNSLLAVQIISAVSNAFEIDIRVDLFYQDQTVRGLSELIISELEELLRDK